ncbi:uncharacterized protein LOC18107685 [Populus trichocarpa]|uniref:uncharacterized protein LOC18107685 n=1 Tax=Populus trichocarpa TaxID=3694 RepID=UPI000D1881D4|nr:uncharacterized protein LOC18107685 [Populus trichocarpa]|eukprot:XP_024445090.1 uncharacterized protein LOC18107685 [Populus trichocarpa]
MAENSSSGGSSMASAPARSDDPAWAHGQVVISVKNSSICVHCSKRINGGGITRLKYHLAGIKGQVEACKKVPPDVKWQMKQLIEDLTMEKEKRKRLRTDIGNSQSFSNDEVEEGGSANPTLSDIDSKATKRLTMQGTSANRKKMTSFVPRTTPSSQPSIKSAMASKKKEHNARKVMARWWYDVNVPFNGAKSYYYQPMIDVIASIRPGFKGPSYHDLRGPLLKDIVHDVHEYLFEIKADWKLYGCSIMADGWSNRRNVPIVNFLAYSPRGTIFLKSVDTSGLRKDKETLLEMFDEVVKEVGQENIVQFVSDNEAAFKAAGKALQQRLLEVCLAQLLDWFPDCDTQDVISGQLEEYKKATGDFGLPLAIRQREKLNPENEETCFDEENELGGNDQLLECLVDDFPYIPPQDQDPYFYVNDGDDV